MTDLAHRVLADASQSGDLDVGEAVALGQGQDLGGEGLGVLDLLSHLLEEQHLVQEPGVDATSRCSLGVAMDSSSSEVCCAVGAGPSQWKTVPFLSRDRMAF